MIRALALATMLAATCCAADGTSLLPADPVAASAAFAFGDHTKRCSATTIDVVGQPFLKAMRVTVVGKPEQSWQVNRLYILPQPVAQGDVLELSCWLRATAPADAKPAVRLIHQLKDKPWTASIEHPVAVTGEWKQFRFVWKAVEDWQGGTHRAAFFLGGAADQQVEFGPIELRSHGQGDPAAVAGATVLAAPKR